MEGSNSDHIIGLVAGQEYPDMNQAIRPGFELGAINAISDCQVDFRVVGSWNDANKSAEIANSMIDNGADIILTIAGVANEGVVSSSKENGTYVFWFDVNGYSIAPGTIIGSTQIALDKAAYERTKLAIKGKLAFGKPEIVGIKEGYVSFANDDTNYKNHVPKEIQQLLKEFKN